MNNAARNDALRTGDFRIVQISADRWIVVNLRTGTKTIGLSLAAARRVMVAAQK